MNKKKLYLSVVALFLVLVAVVILGFQKYSLLKITADNYDTKLKVSEEPIYLSGIDDCIPDNFFLLHSNDLTTSNNYKNNGFEIVRKETNPTRLRITIVSNHTNLIYNVFFEKDKGAIYAQIHSHDYSILLKEIADKLILKEGFILKKSELKRGHDILIKETDNSFIIVEINATYEDPNPPMGLFIRTYSKRKYFQFLQS